MSTLWVVGDSTLSSFDDKYYYQDMDTEPSLAVILTARCRLIILHFQEEAA